MKPKQERKLHPAWWTLIFVTAVIVAIPITLTAFKRNFTSYTKVTLVSDRAGLVMDTNSVVKFRGVEVGRVAAIEPKSPVRLQLEIRSAQVKYIPANVEAQISAPTVFGAKYVDLHAPAAPSRNRLAAGAVLRADKVSIEANTVLKNLVGVLDEIGPAKINAVLAALAEGFRGKGQAMGEAITAFNQVLLDYNPRSELVRADWRAFKGFSDTYSAAAKDLLAAVDAVVVPSEVLIKDQQDLHNDLETLTSLSKAGVRVLEPIEGNLIHLVNGLEPTTRLLMKYNPEFTCTFLGAKLLLDRGYSEAFSYNGRSFIADAGILFGDDAYRYPDNLPVVDIKGGPGGTPSCGSLPDVEKNYPQRYLITNSGFGTGVDVRPNPGVGVPEYASWLPTTRGTPLPPTIMSLGPPAPGPRPCDHPRPGCANTDAPYGAQRYAPDGTPLYSGLPPAPPPGRWPDPGTGRLPAGSEPFVPPHPGTQPVIGPFPPGGPFGPTLDAQQRGPVSPDWVPPIPPAAPAP